MSQRKRQRFVSVCSNCKQRKTKCDRGNPCSQCERQNIQKTCHYQYDVSESSMQPYILSANEPINMSFGKQDHIGRGAAKHFEASKPGKDSYGGLSSYECLLKSNPPRKTTDTINRSTAEQYSDTANGLESSISNHFDVLGDESCPRTPLSNHGDNVGELTKCMTTKAYLLKMDPDDADAYCKIRERSDLESLAGINPYSWAKEVINFYPEKGTKLEGVNTDPSSPLSWSSTLQKDFALKMIWHEYFLNSNHKEKEESANEFVGTSVISSKYNSAIIALSRRGGNETTVKEGVSSSELLPEKFNRELLNRLPPKNVIWILIERYFSWVYPFVPFLDEAFFKSHISRILTDRHGFPEIDVFSWCDYAYIGILLVILRLSYLSYFSNSLPEEDIKIGGHESISLRLVDREFELGPKLIDLSLKCMRRADYNNDDNFSTFLLAFFIKLYYKYSPEGIGLEDGRDVKEINRILIQRARVIGLNEEVSNPAAFAFSSSYLRAKIWCFLVMADLSQSYSYGHQTRIETSGFDTGPPKFLEANSNLLDKDLDREVNNLFFLSCNLSSWLRPLLTAVCQRDGSQISFLCDMISGFEKRLYHEFGSLEVCLHSPEIDDRIRTFRRQFATKSYLVFTTFLISVFWHLFLHFECSEYNLAFLYLKKALLLIFELYASFLVLFGKSTFCCDFIVNPTIEKFIHQANQILVALLLRISLVKYGLEILGSVNDTNSKEYLFLLSEIKEDLLRSVHESMSTLTSLAQNYTDTKRLIKINNLFLSSIRDQAFIQRAYAELKNKLTPKTWATYFQLLEMRRIIISSRPRWEQPTYQETLDAKDFEINPMDLDFDLRDNIFDFNDYFLSDIN